MTDLRREVRQIIREVLSRYLSNILMQEESANRMIDDVTDSILSLRAFKATDEEEPEYRVEREEEFLDKSDISWSILAGKKVTEKHMEKQKEVAEFETMIDEQLARLPLNWTGFREQEQDNFRKFLKAESKKGRELHTWVNWWMSDEWRVANPPWKLDTIKIKWLEAFPKVKDAPPVERDANDAPMSY